MIELLVTACLIAGPQSGGEAIRAQAIPAKADAETFEAIVTHVVPKPEELRWRSIPWRTTLSDGFHDAQAEDKPLFLWTMNGHPLGST